MYPPLIVIRPDEGRQWSSADGDDGGDGHGGVDGDGDGDDGDGDDGDDDGDDGDGDRTTWSFIVRAPWFET